MAKCGLETCVTFQNRIRINICDTTSLIFFRLNAKCDTTCHCYATQLCQRNVGMAGAVIRELFVLGKEVSHLNEEAAWTKPPFLRGGAGESRGIY